MCLRVVFNEVVQTSKYYMRDVTAVESSWLVELAPHFYKQAKVRHTGFVGGCVNLESGLVCSLLSELKTEV